MTDIHPDVLAQQDKHTKDFMEKAMAKGLFAVHPINDSKSKLAPQIKWADLSIKQAAEAILFADRLSGDYVMNILKGQRQAAVEEFKKYIDYKEE